MAAIEPEDAPPETAELGGGDPPPISADGVGFTYRGADHGALSDLTFRVRSGGVLLVLGPSGSGKSTLARALAGLVPGDFPGAWTGSLRVGDLDTSSAARTDLARTVGILFQDPGSQLVMDRAADDVAFGLENRAWPLDLMRATVPVALHEVGLGGFGRRRGARLSGGEQQRLALAGVIAARPGLIVLDEPTANLDPDGSRALFDRLAALKAARDTTIVLVEHRVDLAWPLADIVVALDGNGRMIDTGDRDTVLSRSRDRLVAEGIWLPGDAAAVGLRVGARARPSDVSWARTPPGPDLPQVVSSDRSPSGPLVETDDLRLSYEAGRPVLRDVKLSIEAGERIALVGPNGSGKSTLLRVLAGLLRPSGGTVRIAGCDPDRLSSNELSDLVGFVFQDPELGLLADTVADEVIAGPDPASGPRGSAVTDLMARLGLPLDRFGGRSPYRLSGGEQRRLSVATALVRRPRLLLLDEPTFGQDRRGWESIARIIDELVDAGTTVIAATHDPAFAARVADRRLEMAEGWIIADEAIVMPRNVRAGRAP